MLIWNHWGIQPVQRACLGNLPSYKSCMYSHSLIHSFTHSKTSLLYSQVWLETETLTGHILSTGHFFCINCLITTTTHKTTAIAIIPLIGGQAVRCSHIYIHLCDPFPQGWVGPLTGLPTSVTSKGDEMCWSHWSVIYWGLFLSLYRWLWRRSELPQVPQPWEMSSATNLYGSEPTQS